jgi:hypothetical protein
LLQIRLVPLRLGAGLVSAVVLPTVGGCVGAAQIVRGICNTPEAIAEANSGKRWNHRTREWVREVRAVP